MSQMSEKSSEREAKRFVKSRNTETGKFDLIAFGQRNTANAMSLSRVVVGTGIAEYVVTHPDYRSAALAAITGSVAGVTDASDGHLARNAARRLNAGTTRIGQWIDQLCDKYFGHAVLGSIALAEISSGNRVYGAAILAAEVPIAARDAYATYQRARAPYEAEIKARKAGKIKAAIGMATMTVAASPIAESSWGEAAVAGGMGVFAVTSITSGIELVRSMRENPPIQTDLMPPPPFSDAA